jgi:tRNA dimethylallyltransferase
MRAPLFFLMGPTASGKTPLAIELVQHYPFEIISVDSAMIYRGMDIGTAKPTADELKVAPHHLINICDPAENYSAGNFRRDTLALIPEIIARGKIPLLVGGTMLYFRVLQQGIANLPQANADIREQIEKKALTTGWEALHQELLLIDPDAAKRIHPNDSQRIQRALEVFYLTDKNITTWQAESTNPLSDYDVQAFALAPADRAVLHERIAIRFQQMLAQGFIEEVEQLFLRPDLHENLPSIRSVGYRQVWQYLQGKDDKSAMTEKAIAATRQLAKRQLTWLRSWPQVQWLDSAVLDKKNMIEEIVRNLF